MRHYEIVFLVHPDQSEQVPAMIDRYRALVEQNGGTVHRLEDWGRRQLAYMVEKVYKAHYVLLNIECTKESLDELKRMFKFSDAVIRNLIILKNRAVTNSSPLARSADEQIEGNRNLEEPISKKVEEETKVETVEIEKESVIVDQDKHTIEEKSNQTGEIRTESNQVDVENTINNSLRDEPVSGVDEAKLKEQD